MTDREAMQQALEALASLTAVARRYLPDYDEHPEIQKADAAITSLRQAIEQAEKQEPLGYWNAVEGWVELPEEAQKPTAWGVHDQIALNKAIANHSIPAAPVQEPVTLNRAGVQKLLEQSGYDNANPEEMAAFISGIRHREAEMLDTPPAAPVQEPVALENVYETIIHWDEGGGKRSRRELARRIVALYTIPPAAQHQPLTDEEIDDIWNRYCDEMGEASINDAYDIARAIEAKLKEKNAP